MIKILKTTVLALTLLLSTLNATNPISQAKIGSKGNNPVSQKYLNQGSSNNPVSTEEAVTPTPIPVPPVPPVPITYQVGDYAQGGVVCYVDETGQHGLVCSLIYLDANGGEDTGLAGLAWGPGDVATGATSPFGAENMLTILGIDPGLTSYPAFRACQSYRGGAFSDWFLPSQNTAHDGSGYNEINYIYENSGLAGPVSEGISINQALTNLQAQGVTVQLLSSNGSQFANVSGGNTSLVRAVRAF